MSGFHLSEVQLDLDKVWVSRRSRWWGLLTSDLIGKVDLKNWEGLESQMSVSQVLNCFDRVCAQHLPQLKLTLYELRNVEEMGTIQNFLIQGNGQAPTATHSWGGHFHACRCGCRQSGLRIDRLQQAGLHVLLIPVEGTTKHMGMNLQHARYPSGPELALLNGHTTDIRWGEDARLGVCLVGQFASPLQSAWIFAHLRQAMYRWGFVDGTHCNPHELLQTQKHALLVEAERKGFLQKPAELATSGMDPGVTSEPLGSKEIGQGVISFWGVVHDTVGMIKATAGTTIQDWTQAEQAMYPEGVVLDCFDVHGQLMDRSENIEDNHTYRIVVQPEGDRSTRVVIGGDIPVQQPPIVRSAEELRRLRFLVPQVTKLQAIAPLHAPWGDDEITWHLQAAVDASPHPTTFVDPLVATSVIFHSTSPFLVDKTVTEWSAFHVVLVVWLHQHWIPIFGSVKERHVHYAVWDVSQAHLAQVKELLATITPLLPVDGDSLTFYLHISASTDSCGPDAVVHILEAMKGNMAPTPHERQLQADILHNDYVQAIQAGHIAVCTCLLGAGGSTGSMSEQIRALLISKGVPPHEAGERTQNAIDRIGSAKLGQAMRSPFPWSQLKVLGNQCQPPMRWILPSELEEQIRSNSTQSCLGAGVGESTQRQKREDEPKRCSDCEGSGDPPATGSDPGCGWDFRWGQQRWLH